MTLKMLALSAAAIAALIGAPSAQAADLPAKAPIYKAPAVPDWSPWMIRLRALGVLPNDSGRIDQIAGSDLNNTDSLVPELDISYFFTPNIAVELILAVTPHKISVSSPAALAGLPVGKVWLLPPTLTAQYHFTNFGAFKPYVGAGVNYTWFFNQDAANAPLGGVTVTSLDVKDRAGFVLQAGFDYMFDRHWGVNLDVKKLFLQPTYSATTVGGPAVITGKDKLDPWLVAGGVTYRF